MTDETTTTDELKASRTQRFAEWLMRREEARAEKESSLEGLVKLNVLVSFAKALANRPDIPKDPIVASGGTNLLGTIRELIKNNMPTEQPVHDNTQRKIVIITDGYDTYN